MEITKEHEKLARLLEAWLKEVKHAEKVMDGKVSADVFLAEKLKELYGN